jgi:Variant SH3 domain
MFDYEAVNDMELSFKLGDVLGIVLPETEDHSEWWVAEINGKRGLVPYNYIDLGADGKGGKTPEEAPCSEEVRGQVALARKNARKQKLRDDMQQRKEKLEDIVARRQALEATAATKRQAKDGLSNGLITLREVSDTRSIGYDVQKLMLQFSRETSSAEEHRVWELLLCS